MSMFQILETRLENSGSWSNINRVDDPAKFDILSIPLIQLDETSWVSCACFLAAKSVKRDAKRGHGGYFALAACFMGLIDIQEQEHFWSDSQTLKIPQFCWSNLRVVPEQFKSAGIPSTLCAALCCVPKGLTRGWAGFFSRRVNSSLEFLTPD